MKEQPSPRPTRAARGMAGPRGQLAACLYEFLNVLTRVSFCTLNPEYGESRRWSTRTRCCRCRSASSDVLEKRMLPEAHRDDARRVPPRTMQHARGAGGARRGARPRSQAWLATIPLDEQPEGRHHAVGCDAQALNVIGTFTCEQGSDVVGDDRVGTEFKCRLSVPQAKAAFVNAQKEAAAARRGRSRATSTSCSSASRAAASTSTSCVEQIKHGRDAVKGDRSPTSWATPTRTPSSRGTRTTSARASTPAPSRSPPRPCRRTSTPSSSG